jgi:hypothetical protein
MMNAQVLLSNLQFLGALKIILMQLLASPGNVNNDDQPTL